VQRNQDKNAIFHSLKRKSRATQSPSRGAGYSAAAAEKLKNANPDEASTDRTTLVAACDGKLGIFMTTALIDADAARP